MSLVLPKWLDQVQGVDFSSEKELLADMEEWAVNDGWEVSDGSGLPSELSRRTDVLFEQPAKKRQMRVVVLPKSKKGPGTIRVDASTHRIFELIYQPKTKLWRVETASVPLSDDFRKNGWSWLTDLAFRQ